MAKKRKGPGGRNQWKTEERPKDGHWCPFCRCRFPFAPPNLGELVANQDRLLHQVISTKHTLALVLTAAEQVAQHPPNTESLLVLRGLLDTIRRGEVPE